MNSPNEGPLRVLPPSAPPTLPDRFERLYQMLLDSIPSSVLLIDPQLRIVSANQNFLQKARVREEQVLDRRLEEVFPVAIYEHMNLRLRVADVFRSGEAIKGKRLLYRAPGLLTRTYYYSLIPFRWHGVIEHVLLLMEDVTEQLRLGEEARRAERHLASVVESASDLVVSMDLRGRVLTWNTAAVRVTGFEENDVRNRLLSEMCQPPKRTELAHFLERVPLRGWTDSIEVELVNRSGQVVPISWLCSPMRDTDGRVTGLVGVGRDLTERRKFEAQLLQSEKLAALGVMAGGIAHEIRNPLAVISSAAQLLLEKTLPLNLQRQCAEKIHRGVQRVASIVEGLLRFARPSAREEMHLLDLAAVVEDALALVANQLKLAKIDVQTIYPSAPVVVRGNASLLQQLLTNLLLNAANAVSASSGKIAVCLEQRRQAVLRIADNGTGIPGEVLPKVFDPFFTTKPVGQGTGLGLSVCYAIMQQHEGSIAITSEESKGTSVVLTFPGQEQRKAL